MYVSIDILLTKTEIRMARLILLLLSFLTYSGLHSQVTLQAPTLSQDPNQEFLLEITVVNGFTDISSIGFALQWDTSVIEFVDTDTLGLPPGFGGSPYGYDLLSEGILKFLWIHSTSESSLEDGATLMRLKFKTIGEAGASTTLEFVDSGNLKVAAISNSNPVAVMTTAGEVQITPVTTTIIKEIAQFSLSPNPASSNIFVQILTDKQVDLSWSIYDLAGKEIKVESIKKVIGQQTIQIDRDIFPDAGIYLFSVRSFQGVLTQKLIIQ